MPLETVLFHLDDVIVTNRRFTVKQRSFALRSINGVQLVERGRSWIPVSACALLASFTGYTAIAQADPRLSIVAAGLFALAAALWMLGAPHARITLDTEDGRFTPLISRDRFFVKGAASVLQHVHRPVARGVMSDVANDGAYAPARKAWLLKPRATERAGHAPAIQFLHRPFALRRRPFHPGKTA